MTAQDELSLAYQVTSLDFGMDSVSVTFLRTADMDTQVLHFHNLQVPNDDVDQQRQDVLEAACNLVHEALVLERHSRGGE